VAGITTVDEPVADILGRLQLDAMTARVASNAASRTDRFALLAGLRGRRGLHFAAARTSRGSATRWPTRPSAPPAATPNYELKHLGRDEQAGVEQFDLGHPTSTRSGTTTRTAAFPSTPCATSSFPLNVTLDATGNDPGGRP
jgi:fatty acid synthase